VAAGVGSLFTSAGLEVWYRSLDKPTWTPPDAVFGPVWTVLYVLMAAAMWLVWVRRDEASSGRSASAVTLFTAQLALNASWSGVFFGMREIGWGLVVIVVLWFTIVATIAVFRNIDRGAALLLAPYLAWVTFAGALNAAIWRLA
jgi:translocator protein